MDSLGGNPIMLTILKRNKVMNSELYELLDNVTVTGVDFEKVISIEDCIQFALEDRLDLINAFLVRITNMFYVLHLQYDFNQGIAQSTKIDMVTNDGKVLFKATGNVGFTIDPTNLQTLFETQTYTNTIGVTCKVTIESPKIYSLMQTAQAALVDLLIKTGILGSTNDNVIKYMPVDAELTSVSKFQMVYDEISKWVSQAAITNYLSVKQKYKSSVEEVINDHIEMYTKGAGEITVEDFVDHSNKDLEAAGFGRNELVYGSDQVMYLIPIILYPLMPEELVVYPYTDVKLEYPKTIGFIRKEFKNKGFDTLGEGYGVVVNKD